MNRNGLIKHVNDWIVRLGTQEKVASKCGISKTSLCQWLSGKYGAETGKMDNKIAQALNYKASDWVVVENVKTYRTVRFYFDQCRNEHLWMAVSSNAGSGKTQSLEHIYNNDLTGRVIFLQAEEWAAHQFLIRLYEKLSVEPLRSSYIANSELLNKIISLFNEMSGNPVLIIDEADKLRPSALRQLIPIYNRTEDHLGCLMAGTENFEKEIHAGVRRNAKGYDEIDSRLGRTYVALDGLTEDDVYAVCAANGVTDEVNQSEIWNEVGKIVRLVSVKTVKGVIKKEVPHCDDLRRLKRMIIKYRLMNRINK